MNVLDRPAALADQVVVGVLEGRLVVRAVGAEIGAQEQSLADQQVEGPVDGRRVDVR